MAPTSFVNVNIDDILNELSNDEKIALLAGPNWWNTHKVDRLGIPALSMSDGPNGVRGFSHFKSSPAQCIPCETSMGATFDPELLHEIGALLASEAKLKTATVLLAPTVNIQRNPLGGRAFESFSEDPVLSGTLAAAYVNGLQENGVASTIKHFVCNDQEHERTAASSEVSDRALREVYLMPFMIAQRDAKPLAYMTSYGRVNGVHASENPALIGENGILRKEWGFKGMVMSDWYGTYGTDLPLKGGLDLEMPGPPRWRNNTLIAHNLSCQKLLLSDIDRAAYNMVDFIQKISKRSPQVVFGDQVERETVDTPKIKALNRKFASEGMVLLKNRDSVLPIKPGSKVAVIGPNAKGTVTSGGGSAFLKASYIVNPYDGIVSNAPDGVKVSYAVGCYAHKFLPTLESKLTAPNGQPGWECKFYNHDEKGEAQSDVIAEYVLHDTRVKLNDFLPKGLTPTWTIKLTGNLTVDNTGPFEFGLTVSGRAKLWVNDVLTVDNWTKQRPGDFFYGQGTVEEKNIVNLTAGEPVKIRVEYTNAMIPDGGKKDLSQPALMRGVRLGGAPAIDTDQAIADAVKLAKESDVAVLVVGLTSEWEAEGSDRPTMDLPGRQYELVQKIAEANPETVVVVQAGSATSMPYVDSAGAIVQAWYSGNEVGNAIADVLYGKVNPGGKLSVTFPRKIEDIGPAYANSKSENGKIHYREDLYVGYKHYAKAGTRPLFPFGFGLSYTTFSLSDAKISNVKQSQGDASAFSAEVSVKVSNTGSVAGSEVVQAYVTLPSTSRLSHPKYQLRGFRKVKNLAPGKSEIATIPLTKYAVSYWDDRSSTWVAEAGEYTVSIGTSSEDLQHKLTFTLDKTFTWSGL